ncbi:MAG: hypothetical protein KGS44_09090 [Alphaproteobacteria bacterium]|jgi:hypothetical protein|nr:hypothetical protein [Alphaproteobacteria bacterium]
MTALDGDYGSLVGLAAIALALASATGAAGARSPLSLGLHLMATGGALGAAFAGFGAAGSGLIAAVGLGAVAPLMVIATFALSPRPARVRKDGPPLGSIAVAIALGLALVWAGMDAPPRLSPPAMMLGPAAVALLTSLGVGSMIVAALGAIALLGFGERAESLRAPIRRRAPKANRPEQEAS